MFLTIFFFLSWRSACLRVRSSGDDFGGAFRVRHGTERAQPGPLWSLLSILRTLCSLTMGIFPQRRCFVGGSGKRSEGCDTQLTYVGHSMRNLHDQASSRVRQTSHILPTPFMAFSSTIQQTESCSHGRDTMVQITTVMEAQGTPRDPPHHPAPTQAHGAKCTRMHKHSGCRGGLGAP